MGKRKERRLAAISAAGRRMKLDLFAEPSGEMVDTSLREVGGDLDEDNRAGVPMSPSSGQGQENPLSLLGQYSDDESDGEADKRPKHEVDRSSSSDPDGQVEEGLVDVGIETESNIAEVTDDQQEPDQVETVMKPDDNDVKERDFTPEAIIPSEADPPPEIFPPEASGIQADSDMTGDWKMVLHEQSNRYYYWNTVTGETSWGVPSALALETQVAGEERAGSLVDMNAASVHANNEAAAYAYATEHPADYGTVLEIGKENSEVVHFAYDANQGLTHYSTGVAGVLYQGYDSLHQSQNAIPEQLTTSLDELHVASEDTNKHFTGHSELYEGSDAHSVRLVKYSENLLQRLKALQRSGHTLEGHISIMKEIEVRLSDCQALSSYGSLLLPFWWHTEAHLKQLESAISNEEASLLVQTEGYNKIEEKPHQFSVRDEIPIQGTGAVSDLIEDKIVLSSGENNKPSPSSQTPDGSSDHQVDSEQVQEVVLETHPHPSTIPESHGEEDMDMDVEMEVDEETPGLYTAAPLEQLVHPNAPSTESPAAPSEEPSVPPPPEEEWIPPPPPDDESEPPPLPPEEPPAPFMPPSYADTVPSHSYQAQYDLGFTVQTYEYYVPAASEVTNGNYYAHNEGAYTTEPQQPPFYGPLIETAFPEASVDANPVEPVAYYDVAGVTVPPLPVVSSAGASEFYVECGPVSYHGSNAAVSDHSTSVEFAMDIGSSSLPELNLEAGISQASSTVFTTQAPETTLVNGGAADAPPSAAPKSQPKVARSKKRTVAVVPTLRSNKKVSSLVDKWKAAKEELHGDEEEEPTSAYEILEKKRQKEIEEWCARQIANGEAKDNANFLPLGGDWRERVKRKKAKAKPEAVQTSSDETGNEKGQPDLVELSKDLPSGWQVYWDKSTKGVYYGNTSTSETTWTRPTR